MNTTDKLLVILIKLVIRTHNYVDLDDIQKEVNEIVHEEIDSDLKRKKFDIAIGRNAVA